MASSTSCGHVDTMLLIDLVHDLAKVLFAAKRIDLQSKHLFHAGTRLAPDILRE